jgi:formylglycine-generating enzyme required for sulfatase activity
MSGPKISGLVKCPDEMVPIPEVKFKMGSANGKPDEQPVREVELSAYCMHKHEVTFGQFKAYVAHRARVESTDRGRADPYYARIIKERAYCTRCAPELPEGNERDNQPMCWETWSEAQAFCEFYGMTLPTEAQWERGARGLAGDKEFGTLSGNVNQQEAHCGADAVAPVCSKPENDLGLCDMAGNVWEWTADWYEEDAYKSMESKDPKGPAEGECEFYGGCKYYKVLRGGSFASKPKTLRVANREFHPRTLRAANREFSLAGTRSDVIGFRCVWAPGAVETGLADFLKLYESLSSLHRSLTTGSGANRVGTG